MNLLTSITEPVGALAVGKEYVLRYEENKFKILQEVDCCGPERTVIQTRSSC